MAIYGTNGNDTLFGTTGNDLIYAYIDPTIDGNDQIVGYAGNDTLYGGSGNDTLWGQEGQDSMYGDAGADTLYGGTGDDTLYGGTGNDQLQGKEDNDLLYGENGADSIWGDAGDDYLSGGADNDYLQGDVGNDTFEGGAGTDTIWGNDGLDVISFEHSPSSVTVSLIAGSVSGADGEDFFENIEGAIGSGYPDLLIGEASGNLLSGGAGNDLLDGEAGEDTLSGGDHDDVLMGEYVTPVIEAFFREQIESAGKEGVMAQIIVPTYPDDPDFLVPVGEYDGVVMVYCSGSGGSGWMGSGALLWDGRHILTAAHVVTEASSGIKVDAGRLSIEFRLLEGGTVTIQASAVYVPSDYSPYREDNDIAIIELAEAAPQFADRYDIYRGTDELGQTVTIAGYGSTGTGVTGLDRSYSPGVARYGDNTYDMLSGEWKGFDMWGTDTGCLLYDFDDGTKAHDALGNNSGVLNTGVGDREVSHASGDSGGPGFINGKIAGVHSWGSEMTSYGVKWTPGSRQKQAEFKLVTRRLFMQPPAAAL
jgi:Ca2+-binding RTX toxin-like protein